MKKIRLGLVGANPDRGWALSAHIPALAALRDQFTLQAVSTRRMETATRAATAFGAQSAYGDYRTLLEDRNVDAVSVTVKLAHHHEIVSAALAAGKHVYCEWPLAPSVSEAEDLARQAAQSGRHTMIGLQARRSPALAHLKDLLASGYVGDILSVSVVASGFGWGDAIDPDQTYLFDKSSGATMLSITGGHLLDAVLATCGELRSLSAVLATRQKRVAVLAADQLARRRRYEAVIDFTGVKQAADDVIVAKESFAPTGPDQVLIAGQLANGAPLSLHIRGGSLRASGLLMEITGSEGELRLTAPAGVVQMMPLSLHGARRTEPAIQPLTIESDDTPAISKLSPVAANVARMYAALARDINDGTRTVPDFDLASRRHRLLAAIETSAESGQRVAVES